MSTQVSTAPDSQFLKDEPFDLKGKLPSFTIALQNGLRKCLPFEDQRDFEEAQRARFTLDFEIMPGTHPAKAAIAPD